MKKVVSLLIAVLTAFSVSAVAFAAVDDTVSYSDEGRSMRVGYGTSGDEISIAQDELILVDDRNRVVGPEYHLDPGEDYTFKIYVADQAYSSVDAANVAGITQVTNGMLDEGTLRLRSVKGTSTITSAKVEKKGGGTAATYNLVIKTKDTWSTKLTDVEYNLQVTGQKANPTRDFKTGNLTFEVGYGQYEDSDIEEFEEGDIISISNDKPVILKSQFTTLAKNYNYKAVEFEAEDGSWRYTGRVSGMGDTNFAYSQDVIPSIVTKFEDQDFKFLTFGSGVTFPTSGEMRIDVSDVSSDYSQMYAYLYRDGKLTPIKATYDTGADEIVFRTNYLGSFVITDEEITDTTIINTGDNEEENEAEIIEEDDEEDDDDFLAGENPSTGATRGLDIAVALSAASIAAAGIVSRKRK